MLIATQIVVIYLVLVAFVQAILALGFVLRLVARAPALLGDERCPKAAVILCLRGADPSLSDCLKAVAAQDYPNYEVRVIVDSQSDPAWIVAQQFAAGTSRAVIHVEPLTQRPATCSLKCAALLQAINGLDETVQIVALVDADTIAHPTWLRELATALADPSVGAATGNRWYYPVAPSLGSLVRYLWNAAAIVQMYHYQIAWGGTLALRLEAVRKCGWLDRIGLAFCEDTMLRALLARHGLRVQFVPTLLMVNRENCTLRGFYDWVARQLLTARLYHPHWPLVVGHGFLTTAGMALGAALMFAGAAIRSNEVLAWAAGGLAIYYALMIAMLTLLEAAARQRIAARGESTAWLTWAAVCKLVPAILLTQVLYAAAMCRAIFLKTVGWRGISYKIGQPWQIERLADRPYQAGDQATEEFSL